MELIFWYELLKLISSYNKPQMQLKFKKRFSS